jgi:hypothetical protein
VALGGFQDFQAESANPTRESTGLGQSRGDKVNIAPTDGNIIGGLESAKPEEELCKVGK